MGKTGLHLPTVYCSICHPNWLCQILKDGRKVKVLYFHLISLKLDLHHIRSLIRQEDVSEEAFHDKPSWVDPENDACNLLLRQPVCSFSHLFYFQLGWDFLLSLCLLDKQVHFVLYVKYGAVLRNISADMAKKSQSFSEELQTDFQLDRHLLCALWKDGTISTYRLSLNVSWNCSGCRKSNILNEK